MSSMATTIEYIRYRIPLEQRALFEEGCRQASRNLDRAPECVRYELSHCVEEADYYVLRIEWTSLEDHMQGFREGPQFPEFLGHVRPFIAMIEEMRHYEATGIASAS
jgi:quinol monooxygenase YgiN